MSRARIIYSEILNRISPTHQFDEKVYASNSSQEKTYNPCLNECTSSDEVFDENTDVSNVLSEINTTVEEDWLEQKTSCSSIDCIDETGYLNDESFISNKDPEMCPSDIGLSLVLVNKDKESNLNYCGISEKNTDLNCTDPLLNLVPMNELRKTDSKCDTLNGKDIFASDSSDINLIKGRSMWDTLSIASRKSDCDVGNNGDFSEFNLLTFGFDSNDQINALEVLGDNIRNNSSTKSSNEKCLLTFESSVINKNQISDITSIQNMTKTVNKKSVNTKRPNILRISRQAQIVEIEDRSMRQLDLDTNMYVDDEESRYIIQIPEELNEPAPISIPTVIASKPHLDENTKRLMKQRISALNNIIGAIAIISNVTVNSIPKTKITIKSNHGVKNYEANTAEFIESVQTNHKQSIPIEGEHIVISVQTAANLREDEIKNNKVSSEPEDHLIKEMLDELGISDDILFTILTNLGLRMWICPEIKCKRIFNRVNTLKSHILTHYGLKPYKCDFANCTWSFYTLFKLKRHRDTHLKRKDFACTVPDCNRMFTTIYNLNTHMKLHERPARLKCLVRSCNFKFQTRRAMEIHLKTHEPSIAPYKCSHPGCNKLYFSYSALSIHSRSHLHKEEDLRCQWENCGRLFDKPCRLKAHMRQHTGDKPYVCNFKDCKWAFSSSSKLKRHQYKHNNERKFRCIIGDCNKAFMRSEHLREHTYTHIAQRTFKCPICGEKCSAKATLYLHKKKFHPNGTFNSNKTTEITETYTNSLNNVQINETEAATLSLPTNLSFESNESENETYFITLLPTGNTEEDTDHPVVIQDTDGKEYEINFENMPVNITSKTNFLSRLQNNQTNLNITNCTKAYISYSDMLKQVESSNDNKLSNTSAPTTMMLENHSSDSILETFSTDLLLGSEILQGNSQENVYLSNFMLQDDVNNVELDNGEDEAEYILLLDSETNSNLTESTINLKDLD